jgi:hypothetical protein
MNSPAEDALRSGQARSRLMRGKENEADRYLNFFLPKLSWVGCPGSTRWWLRQYYQWRRTRSAGICTTGSK